MKQKLKQILDLYNNDDRKLAQSIFRYGHKNANKYVRRNRYRTRKKFHELIRGDNEYRTTRKIYPLPDKKPSWNFHDENWERVVDRWEHRRALKEGRCLTVLDDNQQGLNKVSWKDQSTLSIDVPAGKSDRWIYLYLDPVEHLWRNFKWEFTISREAQFKELQFGFRYQDFYNRYRFRHQDGYFHYDLVLNGEFYNSLEQTPFEMENGEDYNITIEAVDNNFTLQVNGTTILNEYDTSNYFERGSCAIILWEENSITPIGAQITDMSVTELLKI